MYYDIIAHENIQQIGLYFRFLQVEQIMYLN